MIGAVNTQRAPKAPSQLGGPAPGKADFWSDLRTELRALCTGEDQGRVFELVCGVLQGVCPEGVGVGRVEARPRGEGATGPGLGLCPIHREGPPRVFSLNFWPETCQTYKRRQWTIRTAPHPRPPAHILVTSFSELSTQGQPPSQLHLPLALLLGKF